MNIFYFYFYFYILFLIILFYILMLLLIFYCCSLLPTVIFGYFYLLSLHCCKFPLKKGILLLLCSYFCRNGMGISIQRSVYEYKFLVENLISVIRRKKVYNFEKEKYQMSKIQRQKFQACCNYYTRTSYSVSEEISGFYETFRNLDFIFIGSVVKGITIKKNMTPVQRYI